MSLSLIRFLGFVPRTPCTPPAANDAAASLAASAVSGPGVGTRNASSWHHISEFLQAQDLATLGLRLVTPSPTDQESK